MSQEGKTAREIARAEDLSLIYEYLVRLTGLNRGKLTLLQSRRERQLSCYELCNAFEGVEQGRWRLKPSAAHSRSAWVSTAVGLFEVHGAKASQHHRAAKLLISFIGAFKDPSAH